MKVQFILLLVCFLSITITGNATIPDSLNKLISKTSKPEEKLRLMEILCNEYLFKDNAKMNTTALRMLKLAQQLNNKRKIGSAYNHIGNYHFLVGEYEPAIAAFNKGIAIQKKLKNQNDVADTYASLGNVYESVGNTNRALHYYLLALKIDTKSGRNDKISDDYANLGVFYAHLGQPKVALRYYQMAFKKDIALDDNKRIASSYMNLGTAYYNLGKLDSSIYYHEKAMALAKKSKNSIGYARALNNLGNLYFEQNDILGSLNAFKASKAIKLEMGDQEGLTIADRNLAEIYMILKKFPEAIFHGNLSKERAAKIKYMEGEADVAKLLSEIYSKMGNHEKSLELYKEFNDLTQKRINEQSFQQIAEMQAKYESEKKGQRIELLKKEDANKKLKINRQNAQIWILIISVLFVFALFTILYMRYRQKQKRLLAEQLLQEQALRHSSVVEAQEKEKMRIAQDLHDGICQKFAATKMHFSNLHETVKEVLPEKYGNYGECIRLLDDATEELRSVAHEMMPPALRQHDLKGALEQLARTTFASIEHTFELLGKPLELSQLQEVNIYRVAQELFANVLKHAKAKNVAVQLLSSSERILLHVEDDGIGVSTDKSTGVGLNNIQLRAQSMKATFNIQPGEEVGSIATFLVPLK